MTAKMTAEKLKERFPDTVLNEEEFRDETTIYVRAEAITDVCRFLRDDSDLKYNFLVDVTAVDMGVNADPRFYVVYHLLSHEHKRRVRLKAPVSGDDPEIDTVINVWATADWHERECWDLMGIRFKGHPDLRRILLPDHWESHPLRKDYPLKGRGET